MILRFVLSILFISYLLITPNIRYHELKFTTSDPIISNRCICIDSIDIKNNGFVKETYDSKGRCIKLEFFEKLNTPYLAVDFPSIVQYCWTDSSLIQTLHQANGELFSEEQVIRPNKIEYILSNSKVTKKKTYHNNELIDETNISLIEIEEADFFMMYSGCETKYNSNYRIKF